MHILSVLPLAAAAVAAAAAAQFSIHIVPSPALPNPAVLPPSTHATLSTLVRPPPAAPRSDDPRAASTAYATARLSPANTLAFANVSAGSYLVDVHCATHVFAPLRVDVDAHGVVEGAWDTFRGNEWDNRGESRVRAAAGGGKAREGVVIDVRALGARNFFMERTKFSILSILKNPMILIALVGGGMFMIMPKLMENMDPEMRAEFEASQASNPMAALLGGGGGGSAAGGKGFDVADYLSGAGAAKEKARKERGGKN